MPYDTIDPRMIFTPPRTQPAKLPESSPDSPGPETPSPSKPLIVVPPPPPLLSIATHTTTKASKPAVRHSLALPPRRVDDHAGHVRPASSASTTSTARRGPSSLCHFSAPQIVPGDVFDASPTKGQVITTPVSTPDDNLALSYNLNTGFPWYDFPAVPGRATLGQGHVNPYLLPSDGAVKLVSSTSTPIPSHTSTPILVPTTNPMTLPISLAQDIGPLDVLPPPSFPTSWSHPGALVPSRVSTPIPRDTTRGRRLTRMGSASAPPPAAPARRTVRYSHSRAPSPPTPTKTKVTEAKVHYAPYPRQAQGATRKTKSGDEHVVSAAEDGTAKVEDKPSNDDDDENEEKQRKDKRNSRPKQPPAKTLPCSYPSCGLFFARMHDLRRHSHIHTGCLPFKCHGCDRGFRRTDARQRHWKQEEECRVAHEEWEQKLGGGSKGRGRKAKKGKAEESEVGNVESFQGPLPSSSWRPSVNPPARYAPIRPHNAAPLARRASSVPLPVLPNPYLPQAYQHMFSAPPTPPVVTSGLPVYYTIPGVPQTGVAGEDDLKWIYDL
ncbi:hypothetical protein FRB99_007612 [Tulasnella sp. 403]|nr:hypothetical protein FRB99_007612 [Tulasnella sp. 403]